MSFYSSLVLAANDGVRRPSGEEVTAVLAECGLHGPQYGQWGFEDPPNPGTEMAWGGLADHISDLFSDPAAAAENDRFFTPDTVGYYAGAEGVQVHSPDGDYIGPGWSINISGYGYFFPWEFADLRDRALRTHALARLKATVQERFGGRFVLPPGEDGDLLRSRLIDGVDGWLWFACESM
ncbi:MAG: hypothetical protein K2X82_04785 [Gemmataceae bacterium]|nr:hypothetical protein [Gemmataceae bacterium]